MSRNLAKAVAYYRTSSAANVGPEKDSLRRQQEAVRSYAAANRIEILQEFYDAAVSGADAIDLRAGFRDLLARVVGNGVGVVLVEDASRFARDLIVQLTGHDRLRALGVELVPVNAPDHFREDTPTAVLVRQVLGAIAQFEKAQLVIKLRVARDRMSAALPKDGKRKRIEGRKSVPADVIAAAKRLARKNPKTGKARSLRKIAEELAKLGHNAPSKKPYGAESVKQMIAAK